MYVSYIKMLMNFNNSTLLDPVSGVFFQAVNAGSDSSINISDSGYHMRQDQHLVGRSITIDTDSSGFSFSFWLYPVNPGQVLNPSSSTLESLRMPVLIFSDALGDFEQVILSVYESTNADGTNRLELKVISYEPSGAIDNQYVAYSESYETLLSHQFFINISAEKNEVQIFIDGEESTLNDITGTLPTSFEYSSMDVGINKIAESSYAFNLANNYGIIDDIGFFNLQFYAESVLPELINEGLETFADLTLRNNESFFQGSLFDDPTTLTINAMIDDMSYVYLARNDGKILFGSPLLWESRRVFSDSREGDILDETMITEMVTQEDVNVDPDDDITTVVTSTPAAIVNGFLEITDSIIRL